MEWKHCRAKMMTEYIFDGAVLPPPFNLVPDVWSLLRYLKPNKKVGCSFNFIGRSCCRFFCFFVFVFVFFFQFKMLHCFLIRPWS